MKLIERTKYMERLERLIANTRHEKYDIEGIHIVDISRWLLNK